MGNTVQGNYTTNPNSDFVAHIKQEREDNGVAYEAAKENEAKQTSLFKVAEKKFFSAKSSGKKGSLPSNYSDLQRNYNNALASSKASEIDTECARYKYNDSIFLYGKLSNAV